MDSEPPDDDESRTLALLQLRIDELERARAEIDLSLARTRSELRQIINRKTPVYTLPNEVLAIIFEARLQALLPKQYPARVPEAHVTRRWREVSLNDPYLWTHIYVATGRKLQLERAAAYIQRSKASPIKVVVKIGIESTDDADISALYDVVGPHIGRWQSFYVVSNWGRGLSHFLRGLPQRTASLLQTIEINLSPLEGEGLDSIPTYELFATGAPSLVSVSLKGIALQCCQLPLLLATTLHVESDHLYPMVTPCESFCNILSHSSALMTLTVSGDVIGDYMPGIRVELPSLRTLNIRVCDAALTIPALLIAISAPALESIILESIIEPDLEPFFRSLDGHVETKYPSLRKLTLCQDAFHDFTQSTWRQLMHALPTITEFALSYHTLDDFFLALQDTGPASDPAVGVPRWPDLHTLTLSDHGLSAGADIRPWHLLSTVEKRIEMGHPLRKLRLSKSIIQQVKNMNTKTHWNDLCERLTVELFSLYPKRAEELIIWRSGLMA